MTLSDAARELAKTLRIHGWFLTVGVTDDSLLIYATRHPLRHEYVAPATWAGFPVRLVVTGQPRVR